jgi:hypothetical protein
VSSPLAVAQPREGDLVVTCAHLDEAPTTHWYTSPHATLVGPEGNLISPTWLVTCEDCLADAEGDPSRVKITRTGDWVGDAPELELPN